MIDDKLKQQMLNQLTELKKANFANAQEILKYAKLLRDRTFKEVVELGFHTLLPEATYNDANRKGGMGNLLEEHYFGYTANSLAEPDFKEAGVELKVSPIEPYTPQRGEKKGIKTIKAGERLVLSMIPNNKEIAEEYEDSTLAAKSQNILLVNYERDCSLPSKDLQKIKMVNLFAPSPEDLKIIADDYRIISSYIREGRAHELSEGLTKYLGACTKGATAKRSLRSQFYPFTHKDGTEEFIPAKSRAFSFKQSYMTAVVQKFKEEQDAADKLIESPSDLDHSSLEEIALSKVNKFVGWEAQQICDEIAPDVELLTEKNGINKSGYRSLAMRILGSKTGKIEEFEKAGIAVRVVRLNRASRPAEDIKLGTISFSQFADGMEWEDTDWYEMLTTPKYMFIVFQESEQGVYVLRGGMFWNVPMSDVGGEAFSENQTLTAYGYWKDAARKANEGVVFTPQKSSWANNFLNASEHPVCHLRPSANKAAYRFADGKEVGNVERDAERLPDGQYMTRQALWLNKDYIKCVISSSGLLR